MDGIPGVDRLVEKANQLQQLMTSGFTSYEVTIQIDCSIAQFYRENSALISSAASLDELRRYVMCRLEPSVDFGGPPRWNRPHVGSRAGGGGMPSQMNFHGGGSIGINFPGHELGANWDGGSMDLVARGGSYGSRSVSAAGVDLVARGNSYGSRPVSASGAIAMGTIRHGRGPYVYGQDPIAQTTYGYFGDALGTPDGGNWRSNHELVPTTGVSRLNTVGGQFGSARIDPSWGHHSFTLYRALEI